MVLEELAFDDAVSFVQWVNWIAAELYVMAVTVFVPLSIGSQTQCFHQLSYLTTSGVLSVFVFVFVVVVGKCPRCVDTFCIRYLFARVTFNLHN